MNKLHKKVNWIYGALLSLALVLGTEFELFGEIYLTDWKTLVAIAVLIPVLSVLTKYLWDLMIRFGGRVNAKEYKNKSADFPVSVNKYLYLKIFALIFILYFIVFLGVFPGFFVYDAQEELMETVLRSFNDRHPLTHVLFLGGVIQLIHKLTGSYNAGIAVFILCIMTLSTAVYAYLVYDLCKKGISRRDALIFTVYLGIFPVLVMYSLCSVKDGICGAFMILALVFFKEMIQNPLGFFKTPNLMAGLVISLTLMMLFRNNAFYAFVVFWIVSVPLFYKIPELSKHTGRWLRSGAFAIAAYLAINSTLIFATNAQSVGHAEMLTVPIQQIARVYSYDYDSLTYEEKKGTTAYIPDEALKRYNPKCSDMVKISFDDEAYNANPAGFYKTWLQIGMEHPVAYINALIGTSYGLWYPWTRIDGYTGNQVFTFVYGDSSYFGYETEEPGHRISILPFIDRVYRFISLDGKFQKIPLIHLLFSPGFIFWIMLFLMNFMIYAGAEKEAMVYLLPLLMYMTCLLGPMSLVRYAYYMWVVVPLMIIEINRKRCYTNNL